MKKAIRKFLARRLGYMVVTNSGKFVHYCFSWREALAWAECYGRVFGPVVIGSPFHKVLAIRSDYQISHIGR